MLGSAHGRAPSPRRSAGRSVLSRLWVSTFAVTRTVLGPSTLTSVIVTAGTGTVVSSVGCGMSLTRSCPPAELRRSARAAVRPRMAPSHVEPPCSRVLPVVRGRVVPATGERRRRRLGAHPCVDEFCPPPPDGNLRYPSRCRGSGGLGDGAERLGVGVRERAHDDVVDRRLVLRQPRRRPRPGRRAAIPTVPGGASSASKWRM